jgi:cellulose synthase/poly-beta-1,6-N-acetylglucosamine synthase-like glycosyltransferase
MTPLVSVVIPAYNAEGLIAQVAEACLAQDYPRTEVIIVDDGSTDGTGEAVQQHPVQYIQQPNRGPAAARNTGWRAAKGEIVCFTDSDCLPAEDWVSRLAECYTSADVGGVGGTYDIANDNNLLALCVHEEIVQRHLRMPKFVNYLGSFNASYRRAVLEQVGGFDESYRTASAEDNDLAYRVIGRGHKLVFTREAVVAHHHPDNLWRYLRQQFWHGYWRMSLYRKHPRMAGGDAYSGIADYAQPPLAVATVCLAPFSFLLPVAYLALALFIILLVLQFPMPLAILRRTGDRRCLALSAATLLRAYARGWGMMLGVLRFFLFRRR